MASASGDTETLPCELLEWDSEHFGFPIARVLGSTLDETAARLIDEWCAVHGVRCLYLLADTDDEESAATARANGYRPVDVRLTLRHDLDSVPEPPPSIRIRDALPEDAPRLRALATRSHHDTRFYHDPGFDRERCDELYATWVENGIHERERWMLVAVVDGAPVGYQLIAPPAPGGIARLVILAVDESQRGRGVGRALVCTGLRRARSSGASAVETATQQRNRRSLRAHLPLGFSCVHSETWHHKWYPDGG
jgi:GNAT superfamily N-acetyltransferase